MTLGKIKIEAFKKEAYKTYTQRCQEEELELEETGNSRNIPRKIPQAQVMNSKLMDLVDKIKGE